MSNAIWCENCWEGDETHAGYCFVCAAVELQAWLWNGGLHAGKLAQEKHGHGLGIDPHNTGRIVRMVEREAAAAAEDYAAWVAARALDLHVGAVRL